jgi:hypothetical protein
MQQDLDEEGRPTRNVPGSATSSAAKVGNRRANPTWQAGFGTRLLLTAILAWVLVSCGNARGPGTAADDESPQPPHTFSPGPPDPSPTYRWLKFSTHVDPGPAIAFGSSLVGYMVRGQGAVPHLDDNVSAAPIDTGYIWPGETLAATSDGGHNWTTVLDGTGDALNGLWGLDLVDADTVFAVGVTGLEVTQNGGQEWSRVPEPNDNQLVSVAFRDLRDGYGLDTDGRLFSTQDSGASWTPEQIPASVPLTALCANPGSAYVADEAGTVYATSSGGTWQRVFSPDVNSQLPVWSQLVCTRSGERLVETSTELGQGAGGFKTETAGYSSSADGATWSALDLPPSQVLPALPFSTGPTDEATSLVSLSQDDWSIESAILDGPNAVGTTTIDGQDLLPNPDPRAKTTDGFVWIHGVADYGGDEWILLTDAATGTSDQPTAQDEVLYVPADGGPTELRFATSPQVPKAG